MSGREVRNLKVHYLSSFQHQEWRNDKNEEMARVKKWQERKMARIKNGKN